VSLLWVNGLRKAFGQILVIADVTFCLLYTSPSPRDS